MRFVIKSPATTRQMNGISAIAAPLLAAACITIIGVIIQEPSSLKYSNLALAVFGAATLAILTSINASIWANYYDREPLGPTVSLAEEPDMTRAEDNTAQLVFAAYKFWVNVSRNAYNAGFYALLIGLSIALLPQNGNNVRYVAACMPALAIVIDLVLYRLAPQTAPEPTYWIIQVEQSGEREGEEPSTVV